MDSQSSSEELPIVVEEQQQQKQKDFSSSAHLKKKNGEAGLQPRLSLSDSSDKCLITSNDDEVLQTAVAVHSSSSNDGDTECDNDNDADDEADHKMTPEEIAQMHESFLNDSWGDNNGYDATHNLPTRNGSLMASVCSTNSDQGGDTTARLKDFDDAMLRDQNRRQNNTNNNDLDSSIQLRHGSSRRALMKTSSLLERANSARDLRRSTVSARSLRTHLSDDGMEYYMSLAPPTEPQLTAQNLLRRSRSCSLDDNAPPPPTFMVAKSSIPISEWDLSNYDSNSDDDGGFGGIDDESVSVPGDLASKVRRRPRVSLHRENLIDSLAWFSFHTPKCVLEDLTSNELEKFEEVLNGASMTVLNTLGQAPPHRAASRPRRSIVSSRSSSATPGDTDSDDGSVSSLSDDESKSGSQSKKYKKRKARSKGKQTADILLSKRLPQNTLKMPYSTKQDCALVFVDISGFTKLSTILDEESLSKVINTYFRMLVDEVVKYGGDILKFAGDAFFAEWRVKTEDDVDAEKIRRLQNHPLTNLRTSFMSLNGDVGNVIEERTITQCVLAASQCAASIVEQYSDFQLQTSRELSISFGKEQQGKSDTMLNVHCGIGCGSLVGLHVGDTINAEDPLLETRREFLFLGDPIDQVSLAEHKASPGEVFASPEVIRELKKTCHVLKELETGGPVCIAARKKSFFQQFEDKQPALAKLATRETTTSYCESLVSKCADMDEMMLARLHRQLSLYVHQVVRDDELDVTTSHHGLGSMRSRHSSTNRHLAEAELRLVYTMFINANIDPVVTGDPEQDAILFQKLQRIMQVTCRELHKCNGQLRQFIVDDKGVVLIGTFGLRGSTFANMVTNHALPATFAIHNSLKIELQVENKIGATFGKAYCGVVGGVHRHEFAVMGAPVNLAARLMYSKDNSGILVDEAVQAHADSRFAFKRLPPIQAKGYNKPVIIFQPLHAVQNKKRGISHGFIGRHRDVAELTDVSKSILNDPDDSSTIMAFIIGEPGIGKSALGLCVYEEMRVYATLHHRKMIFYRSTSTETEQRIPLSSFRKIFLGAVRELCMQDGTLTSYNDDSRLGSQRIIQRRSSMRGVRPSTARTARRMSLGRVPSTRGLQPQRRLHRSDSNQSLASMRSTRSVNVPYLTKMCDICEELQYPHEFADIVGSQLLGLEGADPITHIDGRVPSVDEVVDFLSSVYIRLTEFADLTMIFLDDFQWIDSFTWKVIRALCEKGKNILIMGAMRSQETQALRRMSSVAMWHTRMQSRKGIVEVNIGPLETDEVKQLISKVLDFHIDIIHEQLSNDIYQKTGGITIYVIELLESIKRNKTVAIDEETGLLTWTPEAEREQKRIGSNSVAAIELSFLNRFDSLDLAVRRVLQTCAVLGMSFSLSDVIRVHPEMDELVLELSLNAAVDELILVEDIEDEDDDELSLWSGKGSHVESRNLPSSWNAVDDRFFQFSHAMWRKSVLDAMLSEQKVHLHRTIADAMEKEQVLVMESSDIGRLLTLFDHWKSCGNFGKAAPLALAVGLRLEEWDLSAQSLDLYRDALEMCYESADNPEEGEQTRDENEVWLPASAPPATVEFILRLHIRIAKCHAHLGEQEQCATTFEDAYKIMTTSPKAAKLNQELVLPIISGLCSIAIQRNVINTELLAANEELVERFVREARARDDEIHISRALAMKASFYARLGKFERAIEVQAELEDVYIVEVHSCGIREEYGKDYAGQSYADSVQWYMLVGDQPRAERQVDIVIQRHLPQFDLRDVDTVMEIIFPVLIVLKSIGRSRDAETILFNNAINPYHDLGGSSSCWLKLFNPIAYLFEVLKMIEDGEYDEQMLAEIEDWVMNPERSIFNIDLQYKGYALIGEICSHLAQFKIEQLKDPQLLLDRGHTLLTRVVYAADDDQSERFMVQQARKALNAVNAMEDATEAKEQQDAAAAAAREMIETAPSHQNGGGSNGSSSKSTMLGSSLVTPTDGRKRCCTIL